MTMHDMNPPQPRHSALPNLCSLPAFEAYNTRVSWYTEQTSGVGWSRKQRWQKS